MITVLCFMAGAASSMAADSPGALRVGFAEADITPALGDKPVYMAGFGQNRIAKSVHDPLKARTIVLVSGDSRIALVSIDVVGFFHANVVRVRERLPGFSYVVVSSTHNHEGPDTLGLWGPSPFKSGIDPEYMKLIEDRIVKAVQEAAGRLGQVTARLGTARAPDLLHDGREPYIKHDELVAMEFRAADKLAGVVVQWNCHPETLDSKNTELSADYVGYTVKHLEEKYHCPVVYLTGTVGGLMTSLHVEVKDDKGNLLKDGTFEKTERYGRLVGRLAEHALTQARDVKLTPFTIQRRDVYMPMANKGYQMLRQVGVLDRQTFLWKGDSSKAEAADPKEALAALCMRTEVGRLRLGDLDIALIPGEIYPELVLDKVQDPPDPGADFPSAPIEPAIYKQLPGPHRMIIGLANDEIGYIIPKRQWDEKPPFCYGRTKAQYGEINSVGPDTAPVLCEAFRKMVKGEK
jgi:hypothetical protein